MSKRSTLPARVELHRFPKPWEMSSVLCVSVFSKCISCFPVIKALLHQYVRLMFSFSPFHLQTTLIVKHTAMKPAGSGELSVLSLLETVRPLELTAGTWSRGIRCTQ